MGGSWQDIKNTDKYMSFEINMLIMYHVHHLSTEMKDKNLQKCLKAHLEILTMLL